LSFVTGHLFLLRLNPTILQRTNDEGQMTMSNFLQDLRYGARMLRKKPAFSIIAIITLALGIGVNTAIFSVVNTVLLKSLPYPEAEQLMRIGRGYGPGQVYVASEPKFIYWRDHNQSFESMTAFQGLGAGLNLSGSGEPEYVDGMQVSVDFFRVLGVSPAVGRAFTLEEDTPGGERVVILTDSLWQRRYGAIPDILGQQITLNGQSHTVVGILPADFQLPWSNDVFLPLRPKAGTMDGSHNWTVVGRLKPGVTEAQAAAEMRQIAESFRAEFPRMIQDKETVNIAGWQSLLTSEIRQPLLILLGAVSFVLLIACANVANLQLVRSASRRKEMAIRLAVGARWGRLARQLMTEGILLALIGGGVGVFVAMWGADALKTFSPSGMIPLTGDIDFDWRVLSFTLATTVITGILFGLAPALQATRVDVNPALREESRSSTSSRSRLRSVLVVAEVALAFVLLIGSALLIRTFYNLQQVDMGFNPKNVLTFQVALSGASYNKSAAVAEYVRQAEERLRALPGVESVAMTSNLPMAMQFNLPFMLEGQTEPQGATQYRVISPEYFRVMNIGLRSGRTFDESDKTTSEKVIIINEGFARKYFPDTDPLGKRLCAGCSGFGDPEMRRVVGVVADTKQFGLATDSPYTIFIPLSQMTDQLMLNNKRFLPNNFVIRTARDPMSLSAAVKKEMLDLDLTQPTKSIRTMEQIIALSLESERFNMSLLTVFAGLGLLLAAIGIYGVISYSVMQRTHEIGLRMALGAKRSDVLRLVIQQGMSLAVIGVVIGLGGALALTPVMKSLLFGITAADPFTFIVISLLLAAVALAACYIPARRATRVDPMVALRYE
jgi:predicted permease